MYGYTEEQAHPGVHFRELGIIDLANGNVAVGDGSGEYYLLRKEAYRESLKGSFTVMLQDGRWIRTTDRRMPDGGFVSVQVNISEIREHEETLRTTKEKAEEAGRKKT